MTPTPRPDPNCPEQMLLEEYVLARLDHSAMLLIKTHIEGCVNCTNVTQELKEEADHLIRTLSISRSESTGQCVSEETLALYLDHALSTEETTRTELHLAECDACRQGLVALHLEISTVLGEEKLLEPSGSRAEFVGMTAKNSDRTPAQETAHLTGQPRKTVNAREIYLPALATALMFLATLLVPVQYTIHLQTALVGVWSFFVWKASRSGILDAYFGNRAASFTRGGILLLSLLLFAVSFLGTPLLSSWCLTASLMSFLAVLLLKSKDKAGTATLDRSQPAQVEQDAPAPEKTAPAGVIEDENRPEKSDRSAQG